MVNTFINKDTQKQINLIFIFLNISKNMSFYC